MAARDDLEAELDTSYVASDASRASDVKSWACTPAQGRWSGVRFRQQPWIGNELKRVEHDRPEWRHLMEAGVTDTLASSPLLAKRAPAAGA